MDKVAFVAKWEDKIKREVDIQLTKKHSAVRSNVSDEMFGVQDVLASRPIPSDMAAKVLDADAPLANVKEIEPVLEPTRTK